MLCFAVQVGELDVVCVGVKPLPVLSHHPA